MSILLKSFIPLKVIPKRYSNPAFPVHQFLDRLHSLTYFRIGGRNLFATVSLKCSRSTASISGRIWSTVTSHPQVGLEPTTLRLTEVFSPCTESHYVGDKLSRLNDFDSQRAKMKRDGIVCNSVRSDLGYVTNHVTKNVLHCRRECDDVRSPIFRERSAAIVSW
jgi:hypothetical protein